VTFGCGQGTAAEIRVFQMLASTLQASALVTPRRRDWPPNGQTVSHDQRKQDQTAHSRRIRFVPPERLSLQVLSAFCDILGCTPGDLVTATAENAGVRKTATDDRPAPPTVTKLRPRAARILPDERALLLARQSSSSAGISERAPAAAGSGASPPSGRTGRSAGPASAGHCAPAAAAQVAANNGFFPACDQLTALRFALVAPDSARPTPAPDAVTQLAI
jgi:hypothetical protein